MALQFNALQSVMVQYEYNNGSSGLNDKTLVDLVSVAPSSRPSSGSIVVAMLQFLLRLLHLFLGRECREPILDFVNWRFEEAK